MFVFYHKNRLLVDILKCGILNWSRCYCLSYMKIFFRGFGNTYAKFKPSSFWQSITFLLLFNSRLALNLPKPNNDDFSPPRVSIFITFSFIFSHCCDYLNSALFFEFSVLIFSAILFGNIFGF